MLGKKASRFQVSQSGLQMPKWTMHIRMLLRTEQILKNMRQKVIRDPIVKFYEEVLGSRYQVTYSQEFVRYKTEYTDPSWTEGN